MESQSILAIVLAVLGIVGTSITSYISYKKDTRINKENADRDLQIAKIKADAEDLADELKRVKAEHQEVLEENQRLRSRVSKLEGSLTTLTKELERKEEIIQKLKQNTN